MIEMSKTFEKFQLVFKFVLFFTLKLLFSIHEQYTLAKIWGRVGEGGAAAPQPPTGLFYYFTLFFSPASSLFLFFNFSLYIWRIWFLPSTVPFLCLVSISERSSKNQLSSIWNTKIDIPYLQTNPYWLKAKTINSLVFISSIIK